MSETIAQTEYARGVADALARLELMLDLAREDVRDNSEANPAVADLLMTGQLTFQQHRRIRDIAEAHKLRSAAADALSVAVIQVKGLVS